jgi:hypothetical protein
MGTGRRLVRRAWATVVRREGVRQMTRPEEKLNEVDGGSLRTGKWRRKDRGGAARPKVIVRVALMSKARATKLVSSWRL